MACKGPHTEGVSQKRCITSCTARYARSPPATTCSSTQIFVTSNGSMTGKRIWIAVVPAVFGVVFGWAEWRTWRASREALPAGATDPARIEPGESVLVLGCPLPILHRWRVRIAVRSTDPNRARFVFSGGAVRGLVPEARMMADYAVHELGLPVRNVIVEDQSRTTVENVANSAPLMADSPAIKIASDTYHARRARRILQNQSPELAERLVRARDYIPGEWGPVHLLMIACEGYRDCRRRGCSRAGFGTKPSRVRWPDL
jgi:uncharacterized SAM-binding protein YcdF (DUF218 family)